MSSEREKLIEEIKLIPYHITEHEHSVHPRISLCTNCLADFILNGRRMILEPLIKVNNKYNEAAKECSEDYMLGEWVSDNRYDMQEAIDETLRLSGLLEEK